MRDLLHASWIAIRFLFILQCLDNAIRYFIRKNLPFCIIDQIQTVVLTGEKAGFYQNGGQLIILQHLNWRQILS